MINDSALYLMISTQVLVTGVTLYFFFKVLRTPPRPEPDSYDYNDEEEERKRAGE